MNKKGIFMPIFVLLVIVLFSYTFFVFNTERQDASFNVGAPYVELIDIYSDYESDMFYLESCVQYAGYMALEKFFRYGGVLEKCDGEWIFDSEDCDVNFEEIFEIYLKEKAGKCSNIENIEIIGNQVFVKLEEEMKGKLVEDMDVKYEFKPYFSFDVDFGSMRVLKEKIVSCLDDSDFEGCVGGIDGLKKDRIGNKMFFSYEILEEAIPVFIDGIVVNEKPLLEFNVDFITQGKVIRID